jgi:hypothetical protein
MSRKAFELATRTITLIELITVETNLRYLGTVGYLGRILTYLFRYLCKNKAGTVDIFKPVQRQVPRQIGGFCNRLGHTCRLMVFLSACVASPPQ